LKLIALIVASDLPLLQIGGRSGKTASAHPKT
jgi:hypothetical protein